MDQSERIKKSAVVKRSICINAHKTSVSLENEFWSGLHEIAAQEHVTVPMLVEDIDRLRIRATCPLQFVYSFSTA
jgi:predicted DNA-binding ribbon-helix-helix protein